jgi:hypothetical protein
MASVSTRAIIFGAIEAAACTIIGAIVGSFLWERDWRGGLYASAQSHAWFTISGAVLAVLAYWFVVAWQNRPRGASESTNT